MFIKRIAIFYKNKSRGGVSSCNGGTLLRDYMYHITYSYDNNHEVLLQLTIMLCSFMLTKELNPELHEVHEKCEKYFLEISNRSCLSDEEHNEVVNYLLRLQIENERNLAELLLWFDTTIVQQLSK